MEKVIQNIALKKTIEASELRKNDMCIIKNKIYKITSIWVIRSTTRYNKLCFILYCEEDKSKIDIIYPEILQLELDENSYVKII